MSANVLKRAAEQAPKLMTRSFRAGKAVRDAGHGHGGHDYDHYLHAEHMYEVWNMNHRKLKFGAVCIGMVSSGFLIPSFAIHWQKAKVPKDPKQPK